MSTTMARVKAPVIEIFGPTIQGEGPEAGRPAYFVRFGGCDFRCAWCDSMYAVEPEEVRRHSIQMDDGDIARALADLDDGPSLVVLSGGNPALHELGPLVATLHDGGYQVSVETQGSVWRGWLGEVDHLVVSPKPPSSAMVSAKHHRQFEDFMARALATRVRLSLKVVVFDEADLDFAEALVQANDRSLFLSVGTDQALTDRETKQRILERFAWLSEVICRRPNLADAQVLPQLHVLAWGTQRGV